ncbi:CUL1, partial [Symbiodinium sp. CCMP2456]
MSATQKLDADAKAMATPADSKQEVKPVKVSKPRIDCIDGCRFALVFPIVIAHFARFGTSNLTALKLLTQENVLVGGFFVISGYVSAYTSTKLGERKAEDKKLANPELFFWQRVMAYYPLHFVISCLFAPMFIQVERWYNTPWTTTAFRAFLNFSMLQAWFPKEAEIWNQPTWFLSALTFSNLTMPTLVLPQVAQLSKNGLQKLFAALTGISLLQKASSFEKQQPWRKLARC